LPVSELDRSWTLFIDRDGVINRKREADYVKRWEEFIFVEGVIEAIAVLREVFGRLIVVTNQRGIGRGLMSEADLADIHARMEAAIEAGGGKLDRIYHCPELAENDHRGWRKPQPGMAWQAKADLPEIDFNRSIVIGDAFSDMQFGRNAGLYTVWVGTGEPPAEKRSLIDMQVDSLLAFSQWVERESMEYGV